MPLLSLVVVLIVIGVLMWLLNTQLGGFIAQPYLKIINIIVVICVVLWLLNVVGLFGSIATVNVPRLR